MDDFPPNAHDFHTARARQDRDNGSLSGDEFSIPESPRGFVTHAPKEPFRLGYFDVMCLVINRMIGTGIFNSPKSVIQGTHSTGGALLLWLAGSIYCLAGMHVYIEYGLNVPRYIYEGIEQSVPRSGGDLNYLQYVYRMPAYRDGTVLLCTCVFSVVFIVFGNMASNAISFAVRVLQAAGHENPSNAAVRGIALAVAFATCFIHAFSRRGGIVLNNIFAMIKIMILLLIVVTAIVVGAGGLKDTENVISENTSPSKSFANAPTGTDGANGFAQAFLAIIFSFSGFEQPNYVMGEISRPKRKYPIATVVSVVIVVLLYMAVNISYMVVVPMDRESVYDADKEFAQYFFEKTLGNISAGNNQIGTRVFNAFLAIASLGNIIVMTYTAARVKQEIAKEGIIPFAKFFAQDSDMSVGRLFNWFQEKGWFASLWRIKWFSPDEHRERTPVGAFVLHLISCVILIFATWGMDPNDAYTLLSRLSAYAINAFFGVFLAVGILILRIRGPPPSVQVDDIPVQVQLPQTWREMTGSRIKPALSVTCAIIYAVGGLWPIITSWIRPTDAIKNLPFKWWVLPTIAWSIIGSGIFWFLGFIAVAWYTYKKHYKVFNVEKQPHFEHSSSQDSEGRSGDGLVLIHETVFLSWVGGEMRQRKTSQDDVQNDIDEGPNPLATNSFAGTDFDAFYPQQQQMQQHPPRFDTQYGTGFRS